MRQIKAERTKDFYLPQRAQSTQRFFGIRARTV